MNWLRYTPQHKRRFAVGSALFLGLVFLISGVAKLPGQTDFAHALLRSFWNPAQVYLISHYLPWVETTWGLLLLVGIWPRFIAVLCIPLVFGFVANNSWAIINGISEFPECECFGVLEQYVGAFAPWEALVPDIFLLILALVTMLLDQEGFFTFRPWFFLKQNRKIAP